ncbi:MAG TPA: adenylate/guanylate cyclase domain-containing protein [Polyangiaceae bacterium]|jgi:class 3 adenylate cyclase
MAPSSAARVLQRLTAKLVDRPLEAEFARESFELTIRPVTRFTVSLSAAVFLAYGVHDYLVMPAAMVHHAWGVRYGLAVPMFALVLPLMWTRFYARLHRPALLLFGLTFNAVVLLLGAMAGGDVGALQTSYAPLFVVLGPFIVRFDVAYEVAFALLTVVLYNVIALELGHDSLVVRVSINMAIVSMGFLGALVARQMEAQAREAFLQRRTIRSQLEALDAEKKKSDALLLNVLPAAIAERLKSENRPIADGFQDVSVLFADIVGFTRLSARLTPQELVGRLNQLFSAFDDLLDRFRLEKIKTIGDAYMVVGGLNGGPDHALALAELALDMLARIRELAASYDEDFSVRIGIHTGPVVGGVIGKKKFIYDVWGDTVNIASRMESTGAPGAVQISGETYRRIRNMYVFEDRGEIEVKGKGPMRTWLIKERRKGVHVDRATLVA